MADIPHFALPFRVVGGKVAEVEQDTPDEVAACVEAIVRTRPGDRDELPGFGVSELVFQQAPIDTDRLVEQIEEWEPRTRALATDDPDTFDATIRRVRVDLGSEE